MKISWRSRTPNWRPIVSKKCYQQETEILASNKLFFYLLKNRIKVNFLFPISGWFPNTCTLTWASLGRWGGTFCWMWHSTVGPSGSWWLAVDAGTLPLTGETTWTRGRSRMSPSILSGELYRFHSKASPTVNQKLCKLKALQNDALALLDSFLVIFFPKENLFTYWYSK